MTNQSVPFYLVGGQKTRSVTATSGGWAIAYISIDTSSSPTFKRVFYCEQDVNTNTRYTNKSSHVIVVPITHHFILEQLRELIANLVGVGVALPRVRYVVDLSKNCPHQ